MTITLRRLAPLCILLAAPALPLEPGGKEGGAREGGKAFRMPPPEAQAACASLALDAACSFTFDGRAHTGTCRRGPEGQGPIACAPDHGPRGGGHGQDGGQGKGPPGGV